MLSHRPRNSVGFHTASARSGPLNFHRTAIFNDAFWHLAAEQVRFPVSVDTKSPAIVIIQRTQAPKCPARNRGIRSGVLAGYPDGGDHLPSLWFR